MFVSHIYIKREKGIILIFYIQIWLYSEQILDL